MNMELNKIYLGDSLEILKTFPDNAIDCCVTSPPYYNLRDYGMVGQIGLEETPEEYIAKLVSVFREVKRVLKKEGTCWLNLADSYNGSGQDSGKPKGNQSQAICGGRNVGGGIYSTKATKIVGLKPKDLIGIPWMAAFALRADGWYLRQDIIWHKPSPMPESVTDRCTKAHEYIFLLSKSRKYYYDHKSIMQPSRTAGLKRQGAKKGLKYNPTGKLNGIRNEVVTADLSNKRSVWSVNSHPYPEAHFATFPKKLITDCIKAGSPKEGIILDPFMGSGTTGYVAEMLGRKWVGIELNPEYVALAEKRLYRDAGLFK